MPYRIDATGLAEREMRRLPGHVRQRVRGVVRSFALNPRPSNAKALRGLPGLYRVPLLDWRIIYQIDDDQQTVLVLTVRRKTGPETYEGLEEIES